MQILTSQIGHSARQLGCARTSEFSFRAGAKVAVAAFQIGISTWLIPLSAGEGGATREELTVSS